MVLRRQLSIFIVAIALVGFFVLAMPEKGYSGIGGPGCCIGETGCVEFGEGLVACIGSTVIEDGFCTELGPEGMCVEPVADVPTLSEWGLLAMAGILGIVGFFVIRRRKVTA